MKEVTIISYGAMIQEHVISREKKKNQSFIFYLCTKHFITSPQFELQAQESDEKDINSVI